MTKNKKKLRRAERRYSVSRTAQTLVLTGLLVASGVGSVFAATEINTAANWDASTATGDITYTGATGKEAAVSTSSPNIAGTLGSLTITGADTAAALTAAHDLTFTGAVSITGVIGHLGSLTIDATKTFTSATKTTVGNYGKLAITGTHVGLLEATGADSAAIELTGTQKGDVSLNGANASLTSKDDKAAVWGNVDVTKGTLSTASNALTIMGAGGTGLGNVILGADSTLTLSTGKALNLGTLTVNKDTTVAGLIHLEALDGTKKLTLNENGAISFEDADGLSTNATLNHSAAAKGLLLGTGGSLTAADLTLKGFTNTAAVSTATGALTLKANKLILDEATTFGADAANKATTVTIRTAKNGETVTDFINHDITIKGYASNVGTLKLGEVATTGISNTSKTITLAGKAASTDAVMNVGYATFGVNTINVGSATDAAGGSGTITVANGGTLNANTVNLFGLSGAEAAKLDLAATASKSQTANIGTLNVGGATTHGAVTIAGADAKNLSTLNVGSLNIGTNGVVNVNGNGVLQLTGENATLPTFGANGKLDVAGNGALKTGNLSLADTLLVGASTNGKISLADNALLAVNGTLTLKNDSGATLNTAGDIVANSLNATKLDGTTSAALTVGGTATQNVTLLGTGSGFINASSLTVNAGTLILGDGSAATKGGTFANKVIVSSTANSVLKVASGNWKLTDATDGLKIEVAGGVAVTGGSLDVAQWTSATAGAADVKGGTLNLTGTTVGSVVTGAGDIKASAGGAVTAERSAVITDDFTNKASGVNTFNITDTGVLTIKNATKSMTLAEYGTLKTALMTGTGTLRLDGVTFSDVTDKTTITEVNGVSVADKVVNVATGNSVTSFGTEVKGLKGDGAADIALGITGGLTIVGGNNTDFNLSANGDKNTNITVSAANAQFNLGSAAGPATGGTLLGNVILSDANANLNATNGTFTVGDVIATANNDGIVTADRASLSAKSLGTSTESLAAINTIKGGVVKTAGDAFVTTVNLENGGLQAKDMTVATANVGTGTLLATNDMALTTANLKGGTAQATKNLTVTTANVDGGKLLAGNDLTITTFNNGTANAVNDATIAANNKLTLTNVMNATKVSINAKELAAAAAITAANSNINVGKMTLAAAVTLTEGTNMTVGDFTGSAQTVTVGATTDKIGSSLTINKLTSGAAATTFFVDPLADNSIVHVKSVDAAGTIDKFIAANNGIVSFGEHGMDWAKTQMAESGMAPTATLVLATPVKLDGAGQVLVGKDFDSTGKWQNTGVASTNALDVRGNSLIIADVTNLGSKAALSIGTTTNKTANIDSTAGVRLYSNTLKGDQSYTLVDGIASASGMTQGGIAVTSGSSLKLASLSTSNLLLGLGNVVYTAGAADTGTLKTSTFVRNASDVLPKISTSMGSYLENMARTTGFDTASGNTGVRFVSRALDSRFIGTNDPTRAAATIEGAAQLAAVGATPGMTISASTAATTASNTRTSFATPLMDNTKAVALHQGTDGTISLDSGLSAGSSMKTGLGVWIMPLYQSNNVWGMEAENFKSGYKSDLGGVVLGADYTIDDSLRFGLAFNLGGGYAQSTGDFNATDNSFNFWGLNLYGGWSQNNFGISGDVGYTSTYNKVKQETPTALQMGDIKSDVTSRAWTAGLRGEYKFATEALDIIPHVGVRYLGLTSDSYKAKIGGETVFKADEAYQSIWTFPVGVTFAKEITNDSGWTFRPQVDLGITPATGDVKAKSRVRIPNVDGSAEMKMQVMDYMSYDGGIGLEMKKDNVSFGVNYNIQASEHRTGHGVFGTLRYEF